MTAYEKALLSYILEKNPQKQTTQAIAYMLLHPNATNAEITNAVVVTDRTIRNVRKYAKEKMKEFPPEESATEQQDAEETEESFPKKESNKERNDLINNNIINNNIINNNIINKSYIGNTKRVATHFSSNSKDVIKPMTAEKKVGGRKISREEALNLIAVFCEVMGFRYGNGAIKLNIRPAKELLESGYTNAEIIEAVKWRKEFMQREKKNPQEFIPNLHTVLKYIDNWLGQIEQEKAKEKRGWLI